MKNPKLKKGILVCEQENITPIKLPTGIIGDGVNFNNYKFVFDNSTGVPTLSAISKDTLQETVLLPVFSKDISFTYGQMKINLRIRTAKSFEDLQICNSVIECSHYLKPPHRGLTILMELTNYVDKNEILKHVSKASAFESALTNYSNIVGCAIIDDMKYANPKGRINIAREAKCEKLLESDTAWHLMNRAEVVSLLHVAWISRFAILKSYQKIGLGTILAENVLPIAKSYRLPSADYVEVFSTHSKKDAESILSGNSNYFLCKAGYSVYEELLKSQPYYDEEANAFVTSKKTYFYKRTTL